MKPFHISLPATSANLGPGFDTLALALDLHLEVDAKVADSYSINATGRSAEVCRSLRQNLMLTVYEEILRQAKVLPPPLAIDIKNEIPLGMGCGSSAAARLAGIALADHFGNLQWDDERILLEASRLEGHPDNAAACWLGGFTIAADCHASMKAISVEPPAGWSAILVLSEHPLSTTQARSVLPDIYTSEDAVANLQGAALLTAAFLNGREDLLRFAMQDRLHQPYRFEACPLLPLLLPLAGQSGISGIALSGAGPAVIAIVANPGRIGIAVDRMRAQISDPVEILPVQLHPRVTHHVHSACFK